MAEERKDIANLILTDAEKQAVGVFAANAVAFQAVKKIVLAAVYFNGVLRKGESADPTRNAALSLAFNKEYSNEQIGEDVRGLAEGVRLVELGFQQFEQFKPQDAKPEKPRNPAR